MDLPKCGVYRTTQAVGEISEGRLVYFHNHGNPGPGLYLPESWKNNRAHFSQRGYTLENLELAKSLKAIPAEGLYRVLESFHCCAKECVHFQAGQMVQLGYNGSATPILFLPFWEDSDLKFPTEGIRIVFAYLYFRSWRSN